MAMLVIVRTESVPFLAIPFVDLGCGDVRQVLVCGLLGSDGIRLWFASLSI